VNTGAINPFEALADLCEQEQLWLHIQGRTPLILPDDKPSLRMENTISRVDV
jgi:hypothetical protein